MRKNLLLLLTTAFFIFGNQRSSAQSCFSTGINGTTIGLYCGQTCTNLIFQVPHLKSSDDYVVSTIPFNPLAWTTAGGNVPTEINIDDQFSHLLSLPFNACFYGGSYNSFVIGSNGVISFEASLADCKNGWPLQTGSSPEPIPFVGTLGCASNTSSPKYPKLSIMSPYHDIDPSIASAGKKIEWRVEGTAPCRRLVVSFYKIKLFGDANGINSSQIIVYETTGIIEVNIEQKTIDQQTPIWNGNLAILGLQKDELTAVAAPGKNATIWTANNEAYRFTPNGATSRFVSSQLLTLGGNPIANADTGTTTAGLLDLKFNNFCPSSSGQYIVKTTFADCNTGGSAIVSSDTITITQVTTLPLTGSSTTTTCGASTGTVTGTVPGNAGSPPYRFSIDGGALQTGNTFTGLSAGNHSLHVTDALGCQNTITVFVGTNTTIPATSTNTATSCPGVNNGTITVIPGGGSAPYNFSLDGGPAQTSGTFTGVAPGSHTITFTDAIGCSGSTTATVATGAGLTATQSVTNTSCSTVNDGTATVVPTNGTAPYSFSMSAGPSQASGTFTNLAPGVYSVTYKDANNCTGTISVRILAGAVLASNISFTNPPCAGINNGTITVSPTTGTGPYTFTLNATTNNTGIFNGLAAGTFNISFKDVNGCTGTNSASLVASTAIGTSVAFANVNCFGENNGSITVTPNGGNAPYQFSKDSGASYQASGNFAGLVARTYSIRIKDANGCLKDTVVTISQPTLLTTSAIAVAATCNNNDGTITITAFEGSPSYEYSINNGTNYQGSNVFTVAPGAYSSIKVRDNHGCVANASAVVALNDTMRLSFGPDVTACQGTPAALVPLTNPGTNIFTWTTGAGLTVSSAQNLTVSPDDTTTYTLVAKWGVCQRTASTRLNILTKPVAHAGLDTAICFQTFAFLRGSATRTSGAVGYLWTPTSKTNPANAANSVATPDSSQLFTLEVSDNYGCNFKVYDDVFITMQPPVPAYAGNDTTAIVGVPHQLFSSGGASYVWTPSLPLDNPLSQYPLATLLNDTRFTVTVTDVAGCVGTDDVLIKAYKGPTYYLPNAFSPNGDGLNDIFRPTPVGIVSTEYFRVFNRFGQLIFETTKWLDGWNGTFKGKRQDQGNYVWMIRGKDRNGVIVQMKGSVMLVR